MGWGKFATGSGVSAAALTCGVVVAVFYFLAARLGLALLAKPENVAIFWPASGLAAGALIFLGNAQRIPVAVGVFIATVGANLLGDRNVPMAVVFGLCNAGEAILFAGIIESRIGPNFKFGNLRATMWFFAAAGASTAVMALFAAAAIKVLGGSPASFVSVWAAWWGADAVGIIVLAPFLITLGDIFRDRPPAREFVEGVVVMTAIAVYTLANLLMMSNDKLPWLPFPVAGLFPLFLWLGARCRPAFTTTALFLVALIVVGTMTQGVGRLANESVPFEQRVFAARVALVLVAFCGLMLVTIIAERRSAEARVRFLMNEINHRSNNLLTVVQAIAWRTAKSEKSAEFAASLNQRIAGLAASNDLLVANTIEGIAMGDLILSQLTHLKDLIGHRIVIDGPPVRLKPDAARAIGMAMHELSTNAVKHGALASERGRVRIEWFDGPALVIRWTESGGPPITNSPVREGFGRQVLVDMVEHELDAVVRLDYPQTGLIWELTAPSQRVLDAPRFSLQKRRYQ